MSAFKEMFPNYASSTARSDPVLDTDSSFEKGLRSGITGLESSLHAAAGMAGEVVGADEFAANRYARSRELQTQAQSEAPPVGSYRDVNDLRTGYDYVTGLLGQSIPQTALALAGGVGGAVLKGGATALRAGLGSTAALTVPEAGEIVQRQQTDPEIVNRPAIERAGMAIAGAVPSAAVQSVVPGYVTSQVAGATAKAAAKRGLGATVARNVALDTGLESAGEAGSEVIKQVAANPEKPLEIQPIKEAAVGGAVAGGVMAGLGAPAEYGHGKLSAAGTSATDVVNGAVAKTRERVSAASDAARSRFTDLFNREGREPDLAEGVPLDDFKAPEGADLSTPEARRKAVESHDETMAEKAAAKVNDLISRSGLDPDLKERIAGYVDKVRDPAARAEIATVEKVQQARDAAKSFYERVAENDPGEMKAKVAQAAEAVKEYVSSFKEKPISEAVPETVESIKKLIADPELPANIKAKLEDAAANIGDRAKQAWVAGVAKARELKVDFDELAKGAKSTTKKSEDYSGVRKVIANEIIPALPAHLQEDNVTLDRIANAIRVVAKRMQDGKTDIAPAIGFMRRFFGDQALPVLERAVSAITTDPNAFEGVAKNLLVAHESEAAYATLANVVRESLVNPKEASQADVREVVNGLKSYADGSFNKGRSDAEAKLREMKLRKHADEIFGAKAGKVFEAFQKDYEARQVGEGKGVIQKEGQEEQVGDAAEPTDASGVTTDDALTETELQTEKPRYYGSKNKEKPFILSPKAHKALYANSDSEALRKYEKAREENPTRTVRWVPARVIAKERGISPEELHAMTNGRPDDYGVIEVSGLKTEGRLEKEEAEAMLKGDKTPKSSVIPTDKHGVTFDAFRIGMNSIRKIGRVDGEHNNRTWGRAFAEGLGSAMLHYGAKLKGELPDNLVIGIRNGKKLTYGEVKNFVHDPNIERRAYEKHGEFDEYSTAELQALVDELDAETDPVKREEEFIARADRELEARARTGDVQSDFDADKEKREVQESDPRGNIHAAAREHKGEALVVKHRGDEASASTKRAPDPEAKLAAPSEHVTESRIKPDKQKSYTYRQSLDRMNATEAMKTAIANIIDGSTLFYDSIEHYSNSPIRARALIEAINDTKVKNRRERLNANEAIELLNDYIAKTLKKSPDVAYSMQLKSTVERVAEPPAGRIEHIDVLKRATIRANPDKVYVFGDNMVKRGLGGQAAEARGEPNAVGIPTKYTPSMDANAFFGRDPAAEKAAITAAVDKLVALKAQGKTIVFPSAGVGSGRAQLKERAPDVWAHLQNELKRLTNTKQSMQLNNVDEDSTASDTSRKHVEKYIKDVLGPKVQVEWAKLMHAGEFKFEPGNAHAKIDPEHIIRVSVHSLDPQSTAYHESLHALFQFMRESGNPEVMRTLVKAAQGAPIMNRLRELLKNEPEALKQIETDMEERVAYMYQFYAKGELKLGPATTNIMQRIKNAILQVLGIWTNDQRAEHIMEYFQEGSLMDKFGDRNAVHRALMEPGRNKVVDAAKRAAEPLLRFEQALLGMGVQRLRDTANPALIRIADLVAPEKTGQGADVGFIQASKTEHAAFLNDLGKTLAGISEDDIELAHEALKNHADSAPTPGAEKARAAVRTLLDSMYEYMTKAGVPLGDRGYKKDYFPRVWDHEYISKHQQEFLDMLESVKLRGEWKGDPKAVMDHLIANEGVEQSIQTKRPGMQHTKELKLDFISAKDAAPFVQKKLFYVLNNYMMQATRRAEWARRFNEHGGLDGLIAAAQNDGATEEEIEMTRKFVHGVLGTLGDQINPTARRLFGNLIVYQNIRLLPLAIFSQVVDPMGIVVRGGTLNDAWNSMKRSFKEIPRGFKKNKEKDEWYDLAETLGTIEDTALMHSIGTSYTQGMVSDTARKINDTLFKYNMVEQFTLSTRVAATEAAVRFLARHADGKYNQHSERFLAELGFKSGEIVVKDGRPLITLDEFKGHGMDEKEAAAAAAKMKGAINEWVDGAVLRPNAAERPIWMNDPHYALFAHLKTYVFAFQETILKRAWHELENQNFAPMLGLLSYVPIMLASDLLKGMIQGAGEQPSWKKGWGWQQYMGSAVERAGLYGVGQFGADFMRDIKHGGGGVNSLLGPTFEQSLDAVKIAGGRAQFEPFFMKALPANALYSNILNQPAAEPRVNR